MTTIQIPTHILQDTTITRRAKGLYCEMYLYFAAGNYTLTKSELIKKGIERKTALGAAWQELKDKGYLKQYRTITTNGDGQRTIIHRYELLDQPDPDRPFLVDVIDLKVRPNLDFPSVVNQQNQGR